MNILVTGGAGYIGSKVSLDLIEKGHKVFIIDNLSKGKKKLIPKKSFFFKLDISNKKKISNLIKRHKIEAVYHFAALISVPESLKKPRLYRLNNYYKSKIFIHNCIDNNVKYFIFSSTAAVYESPKKINKIKENFKRNPKNPYGLSKLLVENYIQSLQTNMKFCILRYFNVAGADKKLRTGQLGNNSNLFNNLSNAILHKNKIFEIYGKNYKTKDGSPVRDFIHIEDLSNIHLKTLSYLKKQNKNKVIILNCGYEKGYSVLDIVKFTKKNYNLEYQFVEKRKGDLAYIVANTNKLKKILKWKPKFNSISKMIVSTINWEKKIKNI